MWPSTMRTKRSANTYRSVEDRQARAFQHTLSDIQRVIECFRLRGCGCENSGDRADIAKFRSPVQPDLGATYDRSWGVSLVFNM